jgi:hypothetical protein
VAPIGSGRLRVLGAGAVLLLWGALAWAYLERLDGRAQDDLYITYRYARNLAEGQGFVYNPGERVFGLSEPGLGLLLAGIHRLTGASIPHLGSLVFGLSLLALAAAVLVAAGRRGRVPEALLGGSLLLGWSLIWASHGSGAPLFLALLAAAALLAERAAGPAGGGAAAAGSSWKAAAAGAGLLAGLAVWVRPDAAAGLALLALLLWPRYPRRSVVVGFTGLVVAGIGAGAVVLYFGSILPQTLEAKRVMVEAFLPGNGAAEFWGEALAVFRRHSGSGWWLLLGLGAAGAAPLFRRAGLVGRFLVLFAGVVAIAYSVLGVPLFSWYVLPVEIGLVYGFAFAVGTAARWLARRFPGWPRLARAAAALAAACAVSLPVLLPLAKSSQRWAIDFAGFGRLNAYRDAAEWIRASTPETASVAYLEIGVLGYYSRRPLLDLLGLVSPESLPYVGARDLLGALRARSTDLVVSRPQSRMRPIVGSPWFQASYEEAARFHAPRGGGWVAVYQRKVATGETEGNATEP